MLCDVLKRPPKYRGNEIKKRLSCFDLQGHLTEVFFFLFERGRGEGGGWDIKAFGRLGAGELDVLLISDVVLLHGNKRLFVHNTKTSVCLEVLKWVTHDLSLNFLFAVMIKLVEMSWNQINELERIYEISYI